MTFVACVRPVLVLLAIAGIAGCGAIEDPHRFETMAQQVADIPLDGQGQPKVQSVKAQAEGDLRPALQVDVMDVHDFWDARDGIASATDAVVDGIALRPAIHAQDVPLETVMRPSSGLVQLGAYASEEAARAAWTRLKSGSAAWALEGLTPVYEAVQVNGRRLVRLKVQTPPAGAPAVCAAAGIDDPWCHRAT